MLNSKEQKLGKTILQIANASNVDRGQRDWEHMISSFDVRSAILNPYQEAFVTRMASLEILGAADRHLVLYSFLWLVIAKW